MDSLYASLNFWRNAIRPRCRGTLVPSSQRASPRSGTQSRDQQWPVGMLVQPLALHCISSCARLRDLILRPWPVVHRVYGTYIRIKCRIVVRLYRIPRCSTINSSCSTTPSIEDGVFLAGSYSPPFENVLERGSSHKTSSG